MRCTVFSIGISEHATQDISTLHSDIEAEIAATFDELAAQLQQRREIVLAEAQIATQLMLLVIRAASNVACLTRIFRISVVI